MRRVLLTGSSGGIGNSILSVFSANDYQVVNPTRKQLDLTNTDSLSDSFSSWDFDVLINCAGINEPQRLIDTDDTDYERIMTVNLHSPRKLVQLCLPHMIQKNYGRIVNISSVLQDFAKEGRSSYSISKTGIDMLTKSVAVEYSRYNVLCNTVSPGYIETELTYKNNTSEQIDSITSSLPIRRIGLPDEIAKLVYWLVTENSYITGQNIKIDGGYSCTGK
jgi:NAD(P)-dependent dehydrogenase (short-subunit alcohol dehydrogenase family)